MTALDAIAQRDATITYHDARKRHEHEALICWRRGAITEGWQHARDARLLQRFAPSETLVIKRVDEAYHDNREGAWPE